MAVPTARERRFILRLHPNGTDGDWGFSLVETTGDHREPVAAVPTTRAHRYRKAVVDAVTESGHAAAAVSSHRQRPFNLTCEPGVRLALATLACEPVRKPERRHAITAGISAMSAEETLYWYALVNSLAGPKALRTLLAG